MADDPKDQRPLRADARRNRERILDAAAVVFARDGLEASLDAVAAEAGVGVGTVYRRFPEREMLVTELFTAKIDSFVELAEECAAMEDPWQGLVRFLSEASRRQGEDLAFREIVLGPGATSEMMDMPRQRLAPIVGRMIEGAKANGDLREDFDVLDVPLVEIMLARLNDLTGRVSADLWRRMLTVVIDGLRRDRDQATPMPVDPIRPLDYAAAITNARR
ncbi:MAG: TetR/AcrR family transcriptional regulator [Solirubrobacterales bacterium]|mgnify:CR=1 FL=1|nr:TetR/AcrR family transcriptional regulator [Solirubrobacterales bacterium]OJU94177.1 MAG: hypothetical protein BGO23_00435 [Solirubrobacterales bacterium 67-14]